MPIEMPDITKGPKDVDLSEYTEELESILLRDGRVVQRKTYRLIPKDCIVTGGS